MRRKLFLLFVGLTAVIVFFGQAIAQQESLGEQSQIFSCFYECKPGPDVQGIGTWREVTTLMLANQSNRGINATIVFLDGNQNIIAIAADFLSGEDLDEINVCRTLAATGLPVPQAGLIEVVLNDVGAYGWVKNLVGKFFVDVDEPFEGRVTSIAKTECRLVPPSVATPDEIMGKLPPQIPIAPILIEGTADPSVTCTDNSDCSSQEYCAKAIGDCAGDGICRPRPIYCPFVYDPVCGCDGNTHSNICVAASKGINIHFTGECPP